MTDTRAIRYGADLVGGKIRIVRLISQAGRKLIDLIEDRYPNNISDNLSREIGELYVSIAEKGTLIKSVKIPSGQVQDRNRLALFEFGSTLLDSSDNYFMEVIGDNGTARCLAVAYHRNSVEKNLDFYEDCFIKPSGFEYRGACLAKGYLEYCRPEGGELLFLLDMSGPVISFCFLHKRDVVSAGELAGIQEGAENINNFLTDLKAKIQYELAVLFDHGYSSPLSLIVLSGSQASNSLAEQIETAMGVKTILPSVKTAIFAPEVVDISPKFLVSLGLTADK